MSVIIFVRHGEAQNNTRDLLSSSIEGYPLTRNGIRQVEATANQLKGIKLNAIFSSPVTRTMQTAKIINRYHGLDTTVDHRLSEMSFGKFEGTSAMKGLWQLEMLRARKLEMSIEKQKDIASRMLSFVKSIPQSGNYLAATHQGCIDNMIRFMLGFDEFSGTGVSVKNATATVLEKSKGKIRILAIGSFSVDNRYLRSVIQRRSVPTYKYV